MPQTAEFGTRDLILTRDIDMQSKWDLHARYDILLGAEFPHKKVVDYIASVQQQDDIAAGRNAKAVRDQIIFTRRVSRIDAHRVAA